MEPEEAKRFVELFYPTAWCFHADAGRQWIETMRPSFQRLSTICRSDDEAWVDAAERIAKAIAGEVKHDDQ